MRIELNIADEKAFKDMVAKSGLSITAFFNETISLYDASIQAKERGEELPYETPALKRIQPKPL